MSDTRLETTRKGASIIGTLVRDDGPSSFSAALLRDLDRFCERIENDAEIRGAILTGSGKTFSIGSDLAQIAKGLDDPHDFRRYLTAFNATMHRFERLPVPTVAAINGLTRAGGLEIVLACDLAVIADDARIGDAHAAQFAIPAGGSTQRLPRRVGLPRAKELTWSGRFLEAAEAVACGLCHSAVPADRLMDAAEALLGTFVDKPRPCLSAIKSLIACSESLSVADGTALEMESFLGYVRDHPFVGDAFEAFQQRRRARVPGER